VDPALAEPTPMQLGDLRQRLRAETRKLEAVRELGRVLGATQELDHLLAVLLEKVCEIMDAERATIFLRTDAGDELRSTLSQGGQIAEIRLKLGDGIAGWVAQSGATVNIPDAYGDPRFHPEVDQRTGFRTRSILCMPMPDHQGRIIGVVQVLNKRGRPFDVDDEGLLATVAVHAGISIENGKLYQSVVQKNQALLTAQSALSQRVRELDLLVEIEREASASVDLDEFLDRLLGRAMQLLNAEAGSVLLRERTSGELFFRSARGEGAEHLVKMKIPAGIGIVGWVALHKKSLLVNKPEHDARHDLFIAEKIGVPARNILAVPLLHVGSDDGEALGAFEVLNKVGGPFSDEDLKLLMLIAGQASKAIVLARNRAERLTSERLASIGQMMSSVLHDLKTPMTIASGYAQLAAQCEEADQRERYAGLIVRQFELMSSMTREVLLFARGESNLLVRKVYLHSFVDVVRQQLEREFAGRKIELSIDARYVGAAHFDEDKIFRVVHNLARNAMQAMEGGGTFTMTLDSDGTDLIMIFADTGQGIPEAMQGRLFLAFATSGKADGTGLGLAIVKKIVDEHQGRISYESRTGAGTSFRISIPLARPEPSGVHVLPSTDAPAPQS